MRVPAVAGTFYPRAPDALRKALREAFDGVPGVPRAPGDAGERPLALVVPHAGYTYSARVAAHAYAALRRRPSVVVLVGPDHRGSGMVAASGEDWETPLGVVRTDRALVERLGLLVSERPHVREHSLEVQLPFLQHLWPGGAPEAPPTPPVVCVGMGDQSMGAAQRVADAIVLAAPADALLIASSDMAHEGPHYGREVAHTGGDAGAAARALTQKIASAVEALDAQAVLDAAESSCGHGPVAAVLLAAKARGATRARSLAIATSADVEPWESAVGYLAAVVEAAP